LIRKTLLEIIAVNREDLMLSNNMALGILAMIHKNFDDVADEECILSLALNDSISRMLFHADYDRAIWYSRQALDRFPDSPFHYFTARHLAVTGRCQALSGRVAEASGTLRRALEIGERLPASEEATRHTADVLHDLAMAGDMAGRPGDEGVAYLERAIQLLTATTYEIRKGVCLMGIGNIRYNQGRVQSALEYYLTASLIFDEQSNFPNLASVDSNIGLCYTDLEIPELAEGYLTRSLQLRRKIGNPDEIAISYYNLGRLYDSQDKTDKAIVQMLSCRDYASRSINKHLYRLALESLEKISQKKGDLLSSAAYTDERMKVQLL
jgi:tetratricopeptide (TPR) repeat protein